MRRQRFSRVALDTEYADINIVHDAALPTSQGSEKMWRDTRENVVCASLAAALASGLTTVALGQGNVLPIGAEEVEVQMRQEWKDSETTCVNPNRSRIDHVDIINSDELRKWLITRHSIYGDSVGLLPKGNYVRVASSIEKTGDGITVFGPVYTTLKTTDFRNLVGLPICNYREKDVGTR